MENDKVQPIAYVDDTFSLRLLHAYRRIIDKSNYVKKSWGHLPNLGSVWPNITPPPHLNYFTHPIQYKLQVDFFAIKNDTFSDFWALYDR